MEKTPYQMILAQYQSKIQKYNLNFQEMIEQDEKFCILNQNKL